jgi:hypothetical protein
MLGVQFEQKCHSLMLVSFLLTDFFIAILPVLFTVRHTPILKYVWVFLQWNVGTPCREGKKVKKAPIEGDREDSQGKQYYRSTRQRRAPVRSGLFPAHH